MKQKTGEAATDGAMAAINEALGLEGDEAHVEPPDEDTEDTEVPDGDAGDNEGDETPGEGDGEGEGESESEGEGEGEGEETPEAKAAKEAEAKAKGIADGTRNADGTFKKKEEVKKPADPINDPIPQGLKKETSERMQSLIKIAKEVTAERDQVRTDFDTIVNGIKASGSTPEQYGEVISWMSLFNSPEPQAKMKAYELVNSVAERMAAMLNIDRTADADPLTRHSDLMAEVQANRMNVKFARELARTRDANAFKQQIDTGARQQQQQTLTQQQELNNAKVALNQFEAAMKASDPLYQRKRDAILPALQESFKHIHPSKWAETFQNAYNNVKLRPLPVAPKPGNGQQPLRGGKNPAGGQARGATSMLDAVSGALASMKN